ncbi:MAG: hypothetical protein WCB68_17045 [Pyrinomonadaceae bacterium]
MSATRTDVKTPMRNHYFYGMLLDVYHFELETSYLNAKRWLLNRLVTGYGVVCGLDVKPGPESDQIIVTAGVAIDRWGREIIVPKDTDPITIPSEFIPAPAGPDYEQHGEEGYAQQHQDYKEPYVRTAKHGYPKKEEEEDTWVRALLCYHECEGDPVPVMAGDCHSAEPCAAGTIREKYKIIFKEGRAKPVDIVCRIPDFVPREHMDYRAIVRWVTDGCSDLPMNPCIPIANIRVSGGGHACDEENIDIYIRPIVYSNDLLYEILLSILTEHHQRDVKRDEDEYER